MNVIAIESLEKGHLRSFGEGEYIGDFIPDYGFFKQKGIKNPCIKLKNGKHVWGFQCWWGDAEKFNEKYKALIKSTELVEIEHEILPTNELP